MLVASVAAVYANSVRGVFVYDDLPAIVENPTLRPPWSAQALLFYPGDESGTLGGRPVVNLTLALNYAVGGLNPAGYHAVNLVIHALAALTLLGLVRRTLALTSFGAKWTDRERAATGFIVALLWAVHPLNTEAVTYVVQRTESLMGLLYLASLYSFVRSLNADAVRWRIASFVFCLLGMATKEVMVSAPLVIVAYDRLFAAESWHELWRRRGRFHLALASTWIVLALLVIGTHGRGGTAGASTGANVWPYLLTQATAIPHYLRLALWPGPLVFDYGTALQHDGMAVAASAALVLALLAWSVWTLCRRQAAGFIGLIFFAVLAPSSSVVPIATEPIAEHRMYLPLAALMALGVIAAAAWTRHRSRAAGLVAGVLAGLVAATLGATTILRNRDYSSAIGLWSDTSVKAPANPRARNNLGQARLAAGDPAGARSDFLAATQIDPNYLPAEYNLGAALLDAGQPAEAVAPLERAQGVVRHRAEVRRYLGEAHEQLGHQAEAEKCYRESLALEASPEAAFGLGNTLAAQGRYADAVAPYRTARDLKPAAIDIRNNLANALLFAGRTDDAIAEFRAALSIDPHNDALQKNLALALEVKAKR
ncbi:MAG TPA: tetratricopeptide repeat protein [Candidatus Didemnitutus sp.]|nr:tetratricopeptide repeat protein [Candidatus Didemnitutus sp.]